MGSTSHGIAQCQLEALGDRERISQDFDKNLIS
jgi:hypothetical protein